MKESKELTLSVGVSLYPQDAQKLHELTRCADKAMYVAKHSGKNRYAYYHINPVSAPMKNYQQASPAQNLMPLNLKIVLKRRWTETVMRC